MSMFEKYTRYHVSAFVLTFLSYTMFHATRKTFSNVKTTMAGEWTPSFLNRSLTGQKLAPAPVWQKRDLFTSHDDAEEFMGTLDASFMFAYAVGLFVSGFIADRSDLRVLLSVGMALTSATVFAFGCLMEWRHYYSQPVYITIWVLNGLLQSTGWPCVVAVMGNWFGKGSRGLVMGVWSACASVGNILGAVLVSAVLEYGYDYAFLVTACVLLAGAVVNLFGLVPSPEDVGLFLPTDGQDDESDTDHIDNEIPQNKSVHLDIVNAAFEKDSYISDQSHEEKQTTKSSLEMDVTKLAKFDTTNTKPEDSVVVKGKGEIVHIADINATNGPTQIHTPTSDNSKPGLDSCTMQNEKDNTKRPRYDSHNSQVRQNRPRRNSYNVNTQDGTNRQRYDSYTSQTSTGRRRYDSYRSDMTDKPQAVNFFTALLLPGVVPYALCYAFLKLVNYSFFFWLPFYLSNAYSMKEATADELSIWYDLGGVVGGTVAGFISDRLKARTVVVMPMLLVAVPMLAVYGMSGVAGDMLNNAMLLFVLGCLIGGVANLISAAISADLGRQKALRGNPQALSTVTGILDGTGSAGAALGQVAVPHLQVAFGWRVVFYLFMICTLLTAVCIARIFYREVKHLYKRLRRS